jgi:hypothetical protein
MEQQLYCPPSLQSQRPLPLDKTRMQLDLQGEEPQQLPLLLWRLWQLAAAALAGPGPAGWRSCCGWGSKLCSLLL